MPSFYGVSKDVQVYIVRENDRGETVVTFDGRRASPLPTGTGNVIATYRFGAGAAAPPAGSITQIAKPVPGLTSVRNPVAAAGGADAEGPDSLRTSAPKSALLLGRAVSIQDMEAVAPWRCPACALFTSSGAGTAPSSGQWCRSGTSARVVSS